MIIKNLEISEIILTKINSKTNEIELKINFINDTPLIINTSINEDFELLIEKIIKRIKSSKIPQDKEEDSLLGGITIVNVKNEDDLKEKLPKRFITLSNKLDLLHKTKNANDYMKLFSQISTLEETLYHASS